MRTLLKQPMVYLMLLVTVGIASCEQILERSQPNEQSVSAPPQLPQRTPTAPSLSLSSDSPDYVAKIVEEVGPAVVRIDSSRVVEQPFGRLGRGFNPFAGEAAERVQRGTGSGFIINSDGHILTNAHVVEGADRVTVELQDGRRFRGEVLGTDRTTDVAVIKIDSNNLPVAKLGNSDSLLPGQAAIAIGNPLGLDYTVTQGIISATGRSGADFGGSSRVDFIQTDTAINPGNSGGPLINSRGEVVGMNTAIIQGASGIGFAVPMATAQRVAEQIIATGKAEHPYLGIQTAQLSPELRSQINSSNTGVRINQDEGVIIVAVEPNSPAADGGLRPGDLIETIAGTPVKTPREVQRQVGTSQVGASLQVAVNRNGKTQALTVRPAPLPEQEPG